MFAEHFLVREKRGRGERLQKALPESQHFAASAGSNLKEVCTAEPLTGTDQRVALTNSTLPPVLTAAPAVTLSATAAAPSLVSRSES